MIHLQNIAKAFGGQEIFEGLSWPIPKGERVGLVGPNGAGKTTLFRIMSGSESPDSGVVSVPGGVSVGHLQQEVAAVGRHTVLEEVLQGCSQLLAMERELEMLRSKMEEADPDVLGDLSERYAEVDGHFDTLGGYRLRPRARAILAGMGFSSARMDAALPTLSGGWQMRAVLARLLLQAPDLLLMDEPTNHLDLPSLEWLEGFLGSYKGTVVVISHDRTFLNRLVTQVVELDRGQLETYVGNYDRYEIEKEERRAAQAKAAALHNKEVAHLESFVRRFKAKATKAKQAQSRVKALEKLGTVSGPRARRKTMYLRFPQPSRSGKVVMDLDRIGLAYGDHVVYDSVNFQIERGERVVLVGPNGEGKSTLIKILAGVLPHDAGERLEGHNVSVSYFAQHQVDALDASATVLEEMERAATVDNIGSVRGILGAFLFSGDAVDKKVMVLSGGEKNRLALAKMLINPANLLLLDEPTNHLDMESRQVLLDALAAFEGTVCFISHDRHFINALATRVVHVEAGQLESYPGDYDAYHRKRLQLAAREAEAREVGEQAPDRNTRRGGRRQKAELRRQKAEEMGSLTATLAKIEADIETGELRNAEIEAALADPETYSDPAAAAVLARESKTVTVRLAALFERWEEVAHQVEVIETKYSAP